MKSAILDPFSRRRIGGCFYLVIPVAGEEDEAIAAAFREATQVEKAVDSFLDGDLSIEDLLESVEGNVRDIDQYCEEVEQNLYEELVRSESLKASR